MLTMSNEVSDIWHDQYEDAESVIVSKLAGRSIIRNSELAALATTGVYGRGTIQYDRVRCGDGIATRRFRNVGITGEGEGPERRGPSTMTLSERTWGLIRGYCKTHDVGPSTSGKFGEGTSARLRKLSAIRTSLSQELEDIIDLKLFDRIVSNPFSRSIHVAALSRHSTRFLLGVDKNLEQAAPLPTVEDVVDIWTERWLKPLTERPGFAALQTAQSVDMAGILPGGGQ